MKTSIATLVLMLVVTTLAGAGELKEDLVTLEKGLWTAWGKADGEMFRQHLTEDHVQVVAGMGTFTGRDTIAAEISAGGCKVASFDFHDVKVRQLVPDVAILSYTATQDAICDGTKLPAKIYSSSVYVRKDGKWLSASYQETPAE